ncbi:MAG: 50S ribosomal protein L4 [Pseudomonadales bacterium]|nr:50S ribosomal protein L4 [Pseudomonadales bacterium]
MELALAAGNGTVQVADTAFGREYNEPLVHQVVLAYIHGSHTGTKAQKGRSDVKGSGRKPYRQKGTGRSRAGSRQSPIWRGGGVTFAAKPHFSMQKVNRKMYRAAMCCILSELLRQNRLLPVDEFGVDSHKTKDLARRLQELEVSDVLIVDDQVDDQLRLASRNLKGVRAVAAQFADPVTLISHQKVLMTVSAIRKFEESLQ